MRAVISAGLPSAAARLRSMPDCRWSFSSPSEVFFCALAGVLWYSQFFGLETGKSFLGGSPVLLAFSWSILMSLNVVFSNVWGIILKEWRGCGKKAAAVLVAGLLLLIASVIVVAMAQQ